MITGDFVKPGATVIDVGINRVPAPERGEGKFRLTGDVDFDSAAAVAGAITPVPGGVGPMTIACLLRNTLVAAARRFDAELTAISSFLRHGALSNWQNSPSRQQQPHGWTQINSFSSPLLASSP